MKRITPHLLAIVGLFGLARSGRSQGIAFTPSTGASVTKADLDDAAKPIASLSENDAAPPVATINGTPVNLAAFNVLLTRAAGRKIFELVLDLSLVQQAALDVAIPMDGPAAQKRLQSELASVMQGAGIAQGSDLERQTLLGSILQQRNLSAVEFRLWLETNATITQLTGTPASNGLERTANAQAWLDKARSTVSVTLENPDVAADYATPAAPAKFSLQPSPPDAKSKFATVNGRAVDPAAFRAILMQVAGMRMFQQTFDLILSRQACAAAGIAMDAPSVEDRVQKELDFPQFPVLSFAGAPATDRDHMLGIMLAASNLSLVEFRIKLETNANLRALSQGKISVTADELNGAYLAEYGERRRVHIFLLSADSNEARSIADQYRALLAQHKSPEDAAKELRQPQPASWNISKNARPDPLVDAIKSAAFETLKAPGDLSPQITVPALAGARNQNVLVLLDRIEPDRTTQSPLTQALRADLTQKIAQSKEQSWVATQLQSLHTQAAVQINDPALAQQFAQVAATLQAAQKATPPAPGK